MAGRRAGTQRAGDKDRKIQLQRYVKARDEYGAETQQWITYATPWCNVDPFRVSEMFMNASERSSQIRIFRIPYTRDVGPKDRIVYEGQNYDIQGVEEIGRRQTTQITARLLL